MLQLIVQFEKSSLGRYFNRELQFHAPTPPRGDLKQNMRLSKNPIGIALPLGVGLHGRLFQSVSDGLVAGGRAFLRGLLIGSSTKFAIELK